MIGIMINLQILIASVILGFLITSEAITFDMGIFFVIGVCGNMIVKKSIYKVSLTNVNHGRHDIDVAN